MVCFVTLSTRSPVTVRRAESRHSSTSPEKTPAKRLPPRNPRSLLRKSSRASSSSPDKIMVAGESRQEFVARAVSSSPSPVRSQAPEPSPSVELYTSSFPSSSSLSSSPSKSPSKTGCKKVEQISPADSSIHTECAGSTPGLVTRSPSDSDHSWNVLFQTAPALTPAISPGNLWQQSGSPGLAPPSEVEAAASRRLEARRLEARRLEARRLEARTFLGRPVEMIISERRELLRLNRKPEDQLGKPNKSS